MAKRFTDTEIWDKEWFMELSPKLKCLVKYVRDKADLAGVWHPNWKLANLYVGESVTEQMLLEIDGGKQFEKLANGKVNCIDFVVFQYGKLSIKSPVHRKVMEILDGHEIGYKYPINRVQEEEEDKEEEKDKEKDKEKESGAKKTGAFLPASNLKNINQLSKDLMANTEWVNLTCKTLSIDLAALTAKMIAFLQHLQLNNDTAKTEKDFAKHFINFTRLKQTAKANGSTKKHIGSSHQFEPVTDPNQWKLPPS